MTRASLPALVLVALLSTQRMPAAEDAPPDSTTYAARVHHRSGIERAATIPGQLVYLPFQIAGYGARRSATLIWDERILYRAREYLTFADGRVGVRPLANSLRGVGARVFVKDAVGGIDADATTTLGASASTRQHQLLQLKGRGSRTFSASYSSEPNEGFYGVGHTTNLGDKTTFRQKDIYLGMASRRPLGERIDLDWEVSYHRTEIEDGESRNTPSTRDVYPPGTLPGLDDKVDFLEAGFTMRGRFVDVPGSPTRGNRTRLRLAHRQSVDDDEFSHLRVLILTEQFMELFYRRTVSLQLGSDWRFDPFDNDIPFYDLAAIGGTEILRGFKRGRFRDRGVGWVVGAYKFPVWQLIEGTLFYETGRTFHDVGELSLSDLEASYGGGLRVWVPDGVVFEYIVARSDEATRMLFNFATVF